MKIIVAFLLGLVPFSQALAWTTAPFRVAEGVRVSGGVETGIYYISTTPGWMESSLYFNYFKLYRSRSVVIVRKNGVDEVVFNDFPGGELYETAGGRAEEILDECGVDFAAIDYSLPLEDAVIFLHPSFDGDREVYEALAEKLNRKRGELLRSGKYKINEQAAEFYSSFLD